MIEFHITNADWLTSNRHGIHRGHRAAIVQRLHALAATTARASGLQVPDDPVRITWIVRYPKGVRTDKGEASNAQPTTKALLDGLVPEWLPDDGPRYVLSETFERGPNLDRQRLHVVELHISGPPSGGPSA